MGNEEEEEEGEEREEEEEEDDESVVVGDLGGARVGVWWTRFLFLSNDD